MELVRRGITRSREDAKRLIQAGSVTVNGSELVKAATLVADSATIELVSDEPQWASRAGFKLDHALSEFDIDATGARALDVGASTGGFTDVLLAQGAASVTGVDVGYGQMVWRLSQDPRVTVVDRTNFRTLDPVALGEPFSLVVIDVSFISVRLISAQLAAVGAGSADYVVLVKPQFEVGRGIVGKGGIVTDQAAQAAAIVGVVDELASNGIGALGLTTSPITGSKGNREFLLHARRDGVTALDHAQVATEVSR